MMFIFWLLLSFLLVISGQRCQDEEPLPHSLDFNAISDYHLHGEFKTNFSSINYINFYVAQPSYFRISMNELDVADVDILLMRQQIIVGHSMNVFTQEMIAELLVPGNYTIEFHTFSYGAHLEEGEIENLCQTITIEIALSPQSLVASRRGALRFPTRDQFLMRNLDFSELETLNAIRFDTSTQENKDAYNIQMRAPATGDSDQLFSVVRYDFQIKPKIATNPIFQFECTLGFDFLTGGSLFLLLDQADSEGNPQCQFGSLGSSFNESAGVLRACKVGQSLIQNTNTIKTTLADGNYTLWIYDRVGRRFSDQTPAQRSPDPFSFYLHISQNHHKESVMSCDASPLPASFNIPGLIDETGYVSFRSEVLLDLTLKQESSNFTVTETSLFRIWSESHRVDVDFRLLEDGVEIGRTFLGQWREESMSASLKPDIEYTLQMLYFGTYEAEFCESILVELMIQPKTASYNYDYCTGHTELGPENTRSIGLNTSVSMRYDFKNYSYHFWNRGADGNYSRKEIVYEKYLRMNRDMYLIGRMDTHFFSGLTFQLIKLNSAGRAVTTQMNSGITSPERNNYKIESLLSANTTYRLIIRDLGVISSTVTSAYKDFPACSMYSLSLYLTRFGPSSTGNYTRCPYRYIPSNLNDVKNLESSNRIHISNIFRITGTGVKSQRNLTFNVRERSLFRVTTEEKLIDAVDTDLELFDNKGTRAVAQSQMDGHLERIVYILLPNVNYTLTFTFYTDFDRNYGSCLGINLELEIAPLSRVALPVDNCAVSLPPTKQMVLNLFTPDSFIALNSQYAFRERSQSFEVKIPIKVEDVDAMYCKVQLNYDFLWSDLSVRIVNKATDALVGNGRNMFNLNQINAVKLLPGEYDIIISEPEEKDLQAIARHCSEFNLLLAFTPQSAPSELDFEDSPCPFLYLPKNWNTVMSLHTLSNFSFHEQRSFRINPHKHEDIVKFSVFETSYIRLFVPPYDTFDVDFTLLLVDADAEDEVIRTIGSSTKTLGEENLFAELAKGKYHLKFKYYFVPKDVPCLTFPGEFGVVSKAYYSKAYPPVSSTPCAQLARANTAFVADVVSVGAPTKSYTLYQTGRDFSIKKTFTLTRNALFQGVLNYMFFPGHIYLRLEGKNLISPYLSKPQRERVFAAKMGDSRAFFDHLLYPGEYTIVMDNSANETQLPFACPKFDFEYSITYDIPSDYCDDADQLPTDLYSYRGGAESYGGTQDSYTGAVHIANEHFIIPSNNGDSYSVMHNILFKVKQPSFIRVWAKADYAHNDIDFWFYTNNTLEKAYIAAATGIGDVESHTLFLQPQTEPYLLAIKVIRRSKMTCKYFHFEFLLEPADSVITSKICKSPLPNPVLPPRELRVFDSFAMYGNEFAFTKAYVTANAVLPYSSSRPALVKYNISLHVAGSSDNNNLTLTAIIGYDFISTDFELELHRAGAAKVVHSVSGLSHTNERGIDFQSSLETGLSSGQYYLIISEKIWNYNQTLYRSNRNICEKFHLSILISESSEESQFRIISVSPPAGDSLSTDSYLFIEVEFSHILKEVVDYLELIKTSHSVYLKRSISNTSQEIQPSFALFDGHILYLGFVLTKNVFENYHLHIDATKFQSANNTRAQPYNTIHIYSTLDCNCNSHGHCDERGSSCVCTSPYIGTNCHECEFGYHMEGLYCVKNSFCNATLCNGHGDCSDTFNYPTCKCYTGYESSPVSLCSMCDDGYEGYPVCTPVDDTRTPGSRCTAPLLPRTLDSIAFLEYDGDVHLQGEYFLDPHVYQHEIEFTIKTQSYLRVYVEPHHVDIDIFLYSYNRTTKLKKLLNYGIKINEEETFFQKLEAEVYVLQYVFITDSVALSPCTTFNLELEIASAVTTRALAQRYENEVCIATSYLPAISLPNNIIPDHPWSFGTQEPQTMYSAVTVPEGPDATRPFYNWSFTIPPLTNQVVLFELELGYRFLTGDLAVRLLHKTYVTEGESWDDFIELQDTGFNKYNKHYLSHLLKQGEYQIQIYNPATVGDKKISACSPFTLSISTSLQPKPTSVEKVYCLHPELIKDLDSVFIYDSRDEVNIFDTFFVTNNTNVISFKPGRDSLFRARAHSFDHAALSLQKFENNEWKTLKYARDSVGLYYESLKMNTAYQLLVTLGSSEDFDQCVTLDLEFSLRPIDTVMTQQLNTFCPPSGISVLPNFPSEFGGSVNLPFHSPNNTQYYSFRSFVNDGVIASWKFNTSEAITIDVNLGSSYMIDNFYIELTYPFEVTTNVKWTQTGTFLSLEHSRFLTYLSPGSYTLALKSRSDPEQTSGSPLYARCSQFSFDVKVFSSADWFGNGNECHLGMEGRALPDTLNSMYYLGNNDRIELQSTHWWFPAEVAHQGVQTKEIKFTVDQYSLIRVYTEEHIVDIDLYLFNSTEGIVAEGLNNKGEESFVAEILPGDYTIQLVFINYGTVLPSCPKFNMEIAINSIYALPPLTETCTPRYAVPQLFPSLPPDFSKANASLPFFKSFSGHYQQNIHPDPSKRLLIHSWPIKLDEVSAIHIELGYNFLRNDLTLELTKNGTNKVYVGQNEATRNILNLLFVPEGNYIISIYEPIQNIKKYVHCAEYSMSIRVHDQRNRNSVITDNAAFSQIFPSSFDSIEYLRYSDEMHIQDTFILLPENRQSNSRSTTFTLNVPSMVRISVGQFDHFSIQLSIDGQYLYYGKEMALQSAPGHYTIYWRFTDERSFSEVVRANIQVQIIPTDSLTQQMVSFCAVHEDPWVAPAITIRPSDGYYHLDSMHGRVDQATINQAKSELYSLPFEVKRTSLLSAQVWFNFKLSHFVLRLDSLSRTESAVYGNDDYNHNIMNALIPAGRYALSINKLFNWSAPYTLTCSEFHLKISIKEESDASSSDCSHADTMPWNLDSVDGGSTGVGGPISSQGTLTLYSSQFLLNKKMNKLHTEFTLNSRSVVALFLSDSHYNSVVGFIRSNSTRNMITPFFSKQTSFQSIQFFSLVGAGSPEHDFLLEISYLNENTRQPCPSFSMGLFIQPQFRLQNALEIECRLQGSKTLPPSTVAFPVDQDRVSFHLKSYFDSDDIRQNIDVSHGSAFYYPIEFTITKDSVLDASMTYNGGANLFVLDLYRMDKTTNEWVHVTDGDFSTVGLNVGELTNSLDVYLSSTLSNNWRMVIEQSNEISTGLGLNASKTYCYSYALFFQLASMNSPAVRHIEPPEGTNFKPTSDLNIKILFSIPIYDSASKLLTRDAESMSYLSQSIYLQASNGTQVFPYLVEIPAGNPLPDDYTGWLFTFPHSKFEYGETYQLSLVSARLFSSTHSSFSLGEPRKYTMKALDACGIYGTFDNGLQKCICDMASHRIGANCESCDVGFQMNGDKECVRPPGCLPDSCGCQLFSVKSHCIPIGICSGAAGSNGNFTCTCPTRYTGDRCDSCAVGFTNYPECRSDCKPPCIHGSCDPVKHECVCETNWEGTQCDACTIGYSGSDCSVVASFALAKIIGMIIGGVIIVLFIVVGGWFLKRRYETQQAIALTADILMEGLGGQSETVDLSDQDTSDSSDDFRKPNNNNRNINLEEDDQNISISDDSM